MYKNKQNERHCPRYLHNMVQTYQVVNAQTDKQSVLVTADLITVLTHSEMRSRQKGGHLKRLDHHLHHHHQPSETKQFKLLKKNILREKLLVVIFALIKQLCMKLKIYL